jgi:hypothetical protein
LDVVFIVRSDLFTAATSIRTVETGQRITKENSAAAVASRA